MKPKERTRNNSKRSPSQVLTEPKKMGQSKETLQVFKMLVAKMDELEKRKSK